MDNSLRASCTWLVLASAALAQTPIHQYHGEYEDPLFEFSTGEAIAAVGDVDGDNHDDYVVGMPHFTIGDLIPGAAKMISGKTGLGLYWVLGDGFDFDEFGSAVAGIGDVDGDGISDFAVGAWSASAFSFYAGRLSVFSGASGDHLWSVLGEEGDRLGFAVESVGDTDGDDVPDLLVSCPGGGTDGIGKVQLYSGTGQLLMTWNSNTDKRDFGAAIGMGDYDGDGTLDVYIGAPARDPGDAGLVVVLSGQTGAFLHSSSGGQEYGSTLVVLDDLDDDNADDYAVGEPNAVALSGDELSFVRLISAGKEQVLHQWSGSHDKSLFGAAPGRAGDHDGDGLEDVVVGARLFKASNGTTAGRAVVYSTVSHQPIYHVYGPRGGSFGRSVAAVGDVNRDGRPDFAVGSPTDAAGVVHVFGSSRLRADFAPGLVVQGEPIQLRIRNGPRNAPFVVMLTAVNGVPITKLLLQGQLDDQGAASPGLFNPASLDLDLEFVVYCVRPGGGVVASNGELLYLRS